jgi:hypothetical protein
MDIIQLTILILIFMSFDLILLQNGNTGLGLLSIWFGQVSVQEYQVLPMLLLEIPTGN